MTTNSEIAEEWDANALVRHKQIISGLDISYNQVLMPVILDHLGPVSGEAGVDVGCGSGVLTRALASRGSRIMGIDLSKRMIEIANLEGHELPIIYDVGPFEFVSKKYPSKSFDFAVANMSFNCIPDLGAVLKAIARVLRPSGRLVFTVAHPFFWNVYKRWEDPQTFQYHLEHSIKVRLAISLDPTGLPSETTYFHRPLSRYCSLLKDAGLVIRYLSEPMPTPEVEQLYPAPWRFPRFLLFHSTPTDIPSRSRLNPT